jgi:hypothetical protein
MCKPAIYDQFDRATANFNAVALIRDGVPVGRVLIKHGSAATAYVHIWGTEMTKGHAGGGGYDKSTAAVILAARKVVMPDKRRVRECEAVAAMQEAFADGRDGMGWEQRFEKFGFTIARVI